MVYRVRNVGDPAPQSDRRGILNGSEVALPVSSFVKVPESIRNDFEFLMGFTPPELREDREFLQSSLVYLKLGGGRLARQYLEVTVMPFCEEFDIVRRRLEVDASGESENEEEDDGEEESEADDPDGL